MKIKRFTFLASVIASMIIVSPTLSNINTESISNDKKQTIITNKELQDGYKQFETIKPKSIKLEQTQATIVSSGFLEILEFLGKLLGRFFLSNLLKPITNFLLSWGITLAMVIVVVSVLLGLIYSIIEWVRSNL